MAVQQSSLHDIYQQVKAIAYGIWRKRWYMLGTTWLVSLLGWALVATMPYKYEASAQIFVDTETILPTIAREMGINVDLMRKVEIVRRTVVTRANLEKIIRRSDYLDQLARTDKDLDALVGQLTRDIRIFSLDEGMFRIHYSIDDDRLSDRQRAEVAKRVVANLLAFFLERNTEDGRLVSCVTCASAIRLVVLRRSALALSSRWIKLPADPRYSILSCWNLATEVSASDSFWAYS